VRSQHISVAHGRGNPTAWIPNARIRTTIQTQANAKMKVQNDSAKTKSFAFSLAILILAI
jgi:hypothetical protein